MDLLENVILEICRVDENTIITQDSNPDRPNLEGHKRKDRTSGNAIGLSFESPSALRQHEKSKYGNDGFYGTLCQSQMRILGLSCVITRNLTRYPIFLITLLLIPASRAFISMLLVGRMPRGTQLGIANHEVMDWVSQCDVPIHRGNSCDLKLLSCKFLRRLERANVVGLESYDSEQHALEQVHYGRNIGYLIIPTNYSQHILEFGIAKQFSSNESIEGVKIYGRLDQSDYVKTAFVKKTLMLSYLDYIDKLALSCHLDAIESGLSPPLEFRPPIYGNTLDYYADYIMPGIVLSGIISVSSALTGILLVYDRKGGHLKRAYVAGLTPVEVLTSHLLAQSAIVTIQMVILEVTLHYIFGFHIPGSLWICLVMCILTGVCGSLLGLLLGIICNDEVEALVIEVFVFPLLQFYGGVIWPTENMSNAWKYVGCILPTSSAVLSLRSVTVRELELTHMLVWPGFIVLCIWILVYAICCTVAYKMFKSRQ